jgi:hypothetical protein
MDDPGESVEPIASLPRKKIAPCNLKHKVVYISNLVPPSSPVPGSSS